MDGLRPAVMAAVTLVEHGNFAPGDVAGALRRWEPLARSGAVYRPASNVCGVPECCGLGSRGVLGEAIRALPDWARPACCPTPPCPTIIGESRQA